MSLRVATKIAHIGQPLTGSAALLTFESCIAPPTPAPASLDDTTLSDRYLDLLLVFAAGGTSIVTELPWRHFSEVILEISQRWRNRSGPLAHNLPPSPSPEVAERFYYQQHQSACFNRTASDWSGLSLRVRGADTHAVRTRLVQALLL